VSRRSPIVGLLHVAASILRGAVHPVEFRLRRVLRGRASVDIRSQRNRRRGEDQRGNKGLEHDRVSVGSRARFDTRPLVSGTMRHSDPTERELAHLRLAFASRRRVAPHLTDQLWRRCYEIPWGVTMSCRYCLAEVSPPARVRRAGKEHSRSVARFGNMGRRMHLRHRAVAGRLRLFYAALTRELAKGTGSLWERVEARLQSLSLLMRP